MRVTIDLTAFIPQMTGVDTYLKQLVASLAKVDRTNQYRIYHNHEDRRLFADDLPENFSHTSLSARPRLLRLLSQPVSYTHLRAHETVLDLVCRLLLEKKKNYHKLSITYTHTQITHCVLTADTQDIS